SEVCKLQWADVNFVENTIAIRAAKKRAADHVDYVPLMPAARALLLAWKAFYEGRKVVFCSISKAGKLLADSGLSGEKIRQVCGIGVDDFMPHDARRTLGTRSLENGTPTNYTQKMLRHVDPSMTLEYAKYIETKELSDKVKLGY
ncbi:MAG: tyrosine-type recombinase/integrase, partial [Anaerolineae bacterium]|nr:tyrosine-type recombinase/integrase [Anaerolineae bacterium]